MSVEENMAVYRRFVEEVINQGNLDPIPELYAEDYVDHSRPPNAPEGLEGVRAIPTMFRGAFPDVHFTIDKMVGEGDKVGTYVVGRGTHLGPFMGIPPTGKKVEWESFGIFRVVNGKIVEHWGQPDLFGLLQQLGAIPAPGGRPQGTPAAAR